VVGGGGFRVFSGLLPVFGGVFKGGSMSHTFIFNPLIMYLEVCCGYGHVG